MPTPSPHLKAHIGPPTNSWLHSSHTGFDLSRPSPSPSSAPPPTLTLATTTSRITLSPAKTALLIIDMQNFFLSPSLGRSPSSPGHAAAHALLEKGIPAARKAGVRVVWVNWGLTDSEVREMPPGVSRAFGFWSVPVGDPEGGETRMEEKVAGGEVEREEEEEQQGVAIDKHGVAVKSKGLYRGLGSSMGSVPLPNGDAVDAGRLLMRHTWNADLFPPLRAAYDAGRALPHRPDVWIHKNRMSALWGGTTPLQAFLEEEGITTLLFAGVNTDQCVGGTLMDAFSKGYDCVMLRDACATSSPGFAQQSWEYNVANTFGFVTGCGELEEGVGRMGEVGEGIGF